MLRSKAKDIYGLDTFSFDHDMHNFGGQMTKMDDPFSGFSHPQGLQGLA